MQIINKPIKIMIIFYADGKIEPVKFRIEDKVINVDRAIKPYEKHLAGNIRIVFVCIQNEKDIYKFKYELESSIRSF